MWLVVCDEYMAEGDRAFAHLWGRFVTRRFSNATIPGVSGTEVRLDFQSKSSVQSLELTAFTGYSFWFLLHALPSHNSMNFRSLSPVALFAVLAISACRDSLGGLKATEGTETASFHVYALTGTPASYPTTYVAAARTVSVIDGAGNFDVAFDIDAQGKVIVYPMRLVVSPITPFRDVGLIKGIGTFDAITRAPSTGYLTDKSITLSPGEVVILQTARNTGNNICLYGISPYIFAKIGLDSVDRKDRSIFFKSTVNPNCGFHSFKTGIPVD